MGNYYIIIIFMVPKLKHMVENEMFYMQILEETSGRSDVPCMKEVYVYTTPVCPLRGHQGIRNHQNSPICACIFQSLVKPVSEDLTSAFDENVTAGSDIFREIFRFLWNALYLAVFMGVAVKLLMCLLSPLRSFCRAATVC